MSGRKKAKTPALDSFNELACELNGKLLGDIVRDLVEEGQADVLWELTVAFRKVVGSRAYSGDAVDRARAALTHVFKS